MDTVGRDRLFRAKQHNLPIRVHLKKMYSKYVREVVQYPKIYKHTVGQDMRECFMVLRTKINHAAKLQHKLTALREADTALECLRDAIWAAFNVRCISEGQCGRFSGNCGRQKDVGIGEKRQWATHRLPMGGRTMGIFEPWWRRFWGT